jgi:hypothetical protein
MVVRNVGSRVDPTLIRLTGGRLSSVAPFPAMLLTHNGAKSGVSRTSTVVYFTDASYWRMSSFAGNRNDWQAVREWATCGRVFR